jgi:hypothetical protein
MQVVNHRGSVTGESTAMRDTNTYISIAGMAGAKAPRVIMVAMENP